MTDNVELGRAFRKYYLRGLLRLLGKGKLKLGGSVDFLTDTSERQRWLGELEEIDWNVFIEGPPHGKSNPQNVVKYLAGYLAGGPIANGRIISADQNEVSFWARPKKPAAGHKRHRGMNQARPFRLNARQFMQRWALHILPKGFTRSRRYGGYHGSKREAYLQRCRQLQPKDQQEQTSTTDLPELETELTAATPNCPHCQTEMICIQWQRRPSWREVFERGVYQADAYCPQLHIGGGRAPPPGRIE